MFAKVFLYQNSAATDKIYEYAIPDNLADYLKPAMRVVVPFGKGNKHSQAFVVEVSEQAEYEIGKIKEIVEVLDVAPIVPEYLIEIAKFLHDEYFCTYAEALRTVLPSDDKIVKKLSYCACDYSPIDELSGDEAAVYSLLLEKGEKQSAYIAAKCAAPIERIEQALSRLIRRGAVRQNISFVREERRNYVVCYRLVGDNDLADYLMIIGTRALKQREAVTYIYEHGRQVSRTELLETAHISPSALKTLEEIALIEKVNLSPAAAAGSARDDEPIELNEAQQEVVSAFMKNIDEPQSRYLLFGVTGSGKTRCYFSMFREMLARGRQCMLLVPEIALTPQMLALVDECFAQSAVVIHSKLTPLQRYDAFLKAKSGEARIIIGARSALFMPTAELGMIVIDEEHENSYKSSQSPRYDTVEVAKKISELTGAKLLLASATPSIESYSSAMNGESELLKLTSRVSDIPMPHVEIVDMRSELYRGNRTPLSRILQEKITETLSRREQVLLFLNRRGHSTYIFCRSCGYVHKCPNCDVALTYHAKFGKLVCHYCSHTESVPSVCPSCGSDKIKAMGAGTEKIEEYVRQMFPAAGVVRLDSDTARERGNYERILGSFSRGEADILIGTQMVAKGLDFENVSLVGILLADSSLNFPDINAASRTFQLMAQAAGRAGRRKGGGEVILQTYAPSNPTLLYSSAHDYESFYAYDIAHRSDMCYPPFSEILGIFTANEDEAAALSDCRVIYDALLYMSSSPEYSLDSLKLYEPAPAFLQKLKNKYIFHTLVRVRRNSIFKPAFRRSFDELKQSVRSNVFVEINPITLL